MEGRIVGVFGTDASAKAGLLDPITKKSEAEGGVVVHKRVEAGVNYSFLDDAQFPERVQGYSRIASISDYALYVLPKFAKISPPDGELAVVLDSFGLDGSIVAVDEEPPSAIGSYFKGTRLEGFGASSRSSKSSVVDLSAVKAGPNVPPKGTLVYIDRAFSVKGVGVVVLGFVLGGTVSVHDELRLVPHTDGKTAEVRGIQVSDVDQESVGRGLRVGLSLRGVELKDLDKVSWMDDGSFQVRETVSFDFKQSRFYKQGVDGRDMHLQLPGEILTCRMKAEGPGGEVVTASLPSGAPVWEGMRVGVVDLNGKGLRVAGGGTCRAQS
ncbi:MAG TPA: EF-Tu/IF-2/RF-3 family GTPase [Nitrososphaerales archaeon]|nr:EF-Tu/IF-2/RF-3 family GTPase [Nitrososphaerales archaeon]